MMNRRECVVYECIIRCKCNRERENVHMSSVAFQKGMGIEG